MGRLNTGPVQRQHRKPSPDMSSSREALAELRRREPTFGSEDQLWRTSAAIWPVRVSPNTGKTSHARRLYSPADLDLILTAHRLRVALTLRYDTLGCLARLARRQGISEIDIFDQLLEQAHLDQTGTDGGDLEQMTA